MGTILVYIGGAGLGIALAAGLLAFVRILIRDIVSNDYGMRKGAIVVLYLVVSLVVLFVGVLIS